MPSARGTEKASWSEKRRAVPVNGNQLRFGDQRPALYIKMGIPAGMEACLSRSIWKPCEHSPASSRHIANAEEAVAPRPFNQRGQIPPQRRVGFEDNAGVGRQDADQAGQERTNGDQPVRPSIQGEKGLELAHLRLEGAQIAAAHVGWIADCEVKVRGSPERAAPVRRNKCNSGAQRQGLRVTSGKFQGGEGAVDSDPLSLRPSAQKRQQDGAGSSAEVQNAPCRRGFEQGFDQTLGVRPRDECGCRYGKVMPHEFPHARQVRVGFTVSTAGDQPVNCCLNARWDADVGSQGWCSAERQRDQQAGFAPRRFNPYCPERALGFPNRRLRGDAQGCRSDAIGKPLPLLLRHESLDQRV